MARRVKKTRIYQEPDFAGSTGYLMADGGENQPTGKLSFENLGKLLETNPNIIVFQKDQSDNIVPYRQLSFEAGVQPQLEQIDFKWLYDNLYKLMGCPAFIRWPDADYSSGSPLFFMTGLFTDAQTRHPYFEFTRFDTTTDQMVTEHSILVETDGSYPFDTGTTTCSERKVIPTTDFEYIVDGTDSSAASRVWTKCEAYIAKSTDYKNIHRLVFVDTGSTMAYSKYYSYGGKTNGYHYFYRFSPAALLPTNQDEKGLIDVLKVSSSGVWFYHQTGEEFATELWVSQNYVAQVSDKGLSTNDYTNADKATVTLAADAIPSDASASDQLVKESDLNAALGVFSGSTPGLVPSATAGDADKALRGDGTWGDVSSVSVSYDAVNEELHLDFSAGGN